MRTEILLCIVTVLLLSAKAQAGWTNQSSVLDQDALYLAVGASSDTHACVAGFKQMPGSSQVTPYMRCTFDGKTWSSGQSAAWGSALVFMDDNIGYLGDVVGKVFATNDGGRTWTKVAPASLGNSFFDAHGIVDIALSDDGERIWIASSTGRLSFSKNGGTTWTKLTATLPPGTDLSFSSIAEAEGRVFLAGGLMAAQETQSMDETVPARPGGSGFVIASDDDGASWQTMSENLPYALLDIAMLDAERGLLAGGTSEEGGAILAFTSDAGTTLSVQVPADLPDGDVPGKKLGASSRPGVCLRVKVFPSGAGAALCTTATIDYDGANALYRTFDMGKTWTHEPGFVEGYGDKKGNLFLTALAGLDLAMPTCNSGWVAGQGQLIHRFDADDEHDCDTPLEAEPGAENESGAHEAECGCAFVGSANRWNWLGALLGLLL